MDNSYIRYNNILRAYGAQPCIFTFSNPEEDSYTWHDAREDASMCYYSMLETNQYKMGLIDLDKPQREHDYYFVGIYPTEFTQFMYPYARLGCDWKEGEGALLGTALNYQETCSIISKNYDELCELFPNEVEIIRGALRRRQIANIKRSILTKMTKLCIQRIFQSIDQLRNRYPNDSEIEELHSNFAIDVMSSDIINGFYVLRQDRQVA